MTRVIRTALLAAAATLAVALSAGPAAAAGSPTLGGERLMNQTANDPQATCMTFGGGFNYTVSGRAVGAYAGTFTETGTVRTAGDTMTSPIVSVQSTFTITSPAGIVTGTRAYTAGISTGSGGCESGWTNDNARLVAQKVGYTAVLPDGTTDVGYASVSFYDTTTIGSYDSVFVSTRPAVVDTDGDGVLDDVDNCDTVPNPSQSDLDADGMGDACDSDDDGDGAADTADNCPATPNASQSDVDGDGAGDACDPDVDGDGAANESDNCPSTPNAGQADIDGDGIGDACDPTDDRTAAQKAAALVEAVKGHGPGKSLEMQARAILGAIVAGEDACDEISSFVGHVDAQRGKKLTEAQADDFSAAAEAIAADLGC
jgi:hypothetical protein